MLLCGLALDYCVYYSAVDGRKLGFEVIVPIDLTKAIDSPPGHLSSALKTMAENRVQFVTGHHDLMTLMSAPCKFIKHARNGLIPESYESGTPHAKSIQPSGYARL